jgi:hypothetical protein
MAKRTEKKKQAGQPWTVRYGDNDAELIRQVAQIKALKPGPCIRMLSVEKAREVIAEAKAKKGAA